MNNIENRTGENLGAPTDGPNSDLDQGEQAATLYNDQHPPIDLDSEIQEMAESIANDPTLIKKRIDTVNRSGVVGERKVIAMNFAALDSRLLLKDRSGSNALANRHPVLTQLMEYRKVAKLLQSFIIPIPKFVNSRTGRIHAEYNQLGADTGRFSCRNPSLQNIPKSKSFRSCFVAAPGNVLIRADYSQIELRIAAEITGDNKMIEAFTNSHDLHRLTASIFSGKQIDQIEKKERQAAKAVNFGLIYAMGAETLMNYAKNNYGVTMTLDQAENFRNKYFAAYGGIKRWHDKVQVSNSWETRTLGNRQRLWGSEPKFTTLLNSPVQGTGADIIKRALCLIYEKLDKIESKLIACIHDEIILETPENRKEDAARILKKTMIEAGKYYLKRVPVEVEVSTGSSWAD